ncbi:MAG: SMC-Scp complex subunit ScpB [Gemmatimonadetes bacterium]|nr:SMC-Scp complex subunit ScpB [Gemmatimonadota bacterium]
MNPLAQLIEAALFAAPRPVTVEELQTLDPDVSLAEFRQAIEQLREHYDFDGHGVEMVEMAGGFQIVTRPAFAAAIERAQLNQKPPRLSAAMLETLATIAYRQPVGRAEIEEIRGVNAAGVLRTLQERGLIEVTGRGEALGRPLLYSTTPQFLELLGLPDLANLPRAEELSIALQAPKPIDDVDQDAAAFVEADS